MREPERENNKPLTKISTIVTVVPDWLQAALTVLIESLPEFNLIARVSSVEQLLLLQLAQNPDLIVMDIQNDLKLVEIHLSRIKNIWPETYCIVLTKYTKHRAHLLAYGADEVLIEGVPPQRLIDAIRNYRNQK